MPNIILLIMLLLFSCFGESYAAKSPSRNYQNIQFERLSIERGLSQITVHAILQDSKGFMWFGTEDGLNRYDGYNFVTYRSDSFDSTTIGDNFIWSIVEDKSGNIWVGTNSGGLNKYNYSNDSFVRYLYDASDSNSIVENNIRALYCDTDDVLWIGSNSEGLCSFDIKKNKFRKINFNYNSPDINSVRYINQDKNDNIWIATEGGLLKLSENAGQISLITSFDTGHKKVTVNNFWTILPDESILWIGTYRYGLIKYNTETGLSEIYNVENKSGIADNNITDLITDDLNNLWICTENGLSILDKKKQTIVTYRNEASNVNSLSNNILRSCYKDNSNLIWLGTFGGGINKINLNRKFKIYTHNPTNKNSISYNLIRSISEDHLGNIWIGTLGNGLNKLNRPGNKFEFFSSDDPGPHISHNIVTSILEDHQGYMWVGTWGGGLNKIRFHFDAEKNKTTIQSVEYYSKNTKEKEISSNIVQALFEDSKNNLWIGTEEGLDLYSPDKNKYVRYNHTPEKINSISDNRIQSNCIIEDKFGNIWVGTWKGLNKFSCPVNSDFFKKSNIKITRFINDIKNSNSISDNRIISLYEDKFNSDDSTSIIWIGTVGGGLNKLVISYSPENNSVWEYNFNHYTEVNGLPNNVVYGILGDNKGNIWLSTNNGISEFNPNTLKFRNYDIRDGLQSNQFSWGAYYKTSDGELFFGGTNGLNSFQPEEITENNYIPPVYITNCIISKSEKNSSFEFNTFKDNLVIDLPYDTYSIYFEFAGLDYTTPEKNQYEYILEGFEKNWANPITKNSVVYSNITDGEYVFKVKASNNDGLWNNSGTSIRINIQTPFWKTWWFISLIFAIIIIIVAYIIITQIKNILAVERLRTKLAADLHDNIGSSLTEISILSEVISTKLKDSDNDIKKNLNRISEKSRNLIDKMSDIVWLVNPKRDSLYDLILRLQDTYSELLADTNISLRSENLKALEKVSLKMEHRQHLFLIFKEAINNSITHSTCTEISLNAKVQGRKLEMILKDNGQGFETSEKKKGNGLENMKSRAELIGGKLFISSSYENGTIIKYIGSIN